MDMKYEEFLTVKHMYIHEPLVFVMNRCVCGVNVVANAEYMLKINQENVLGEIFMLLPTHIIVVDLPCKCLP